jgi:hypothetical protein
VAGQLDHADPARDARVGQPVAGARAGHHPGHGQQPGGIPPREDAGERVRSDDQEQLGARPAPAVQLLDRVDGVARSRTVDLDAAGPERRRAGGRDRGHGEAVGGGGDRPVALLPRRPGGDEQHLVEREGAGDLARLQQVPVVDRVEGAPEDPEPRHRRLTLPG